MNSQASFTPSSAATAVAALKKFSARSTRPAPCLRLISSSYFWRISSSGSLSFSPTISTTRRVIARREKHHPLDQLRAGGVTEDPVVPPPFAHLVEQVLDRREGPLLRVR